MGLPDSAQPMPKQPRPRPQVMTQVPRAVQHSAIWRDRVRSCSRPALHTQLSCSQAGLHRSSCHLSCRLEDDLVQEDSPFRGTKQFGMCWVTERGMAAVGTTLHIQQHARFPDGRMQIDSKGTPSYDPAHATRFNNFSRGEHTLACQRATIAMRNPRSTSIESGRGEAWLDGTQLSFLGRLHLHRKWGPPQH